MSCVDFHEFSREEYQIRYTKLKQMMEKREIEALLVSDSTNCRYLTGYAAPTRHRPIFVILKKNGDVVLICTKAWAKEAEKITWVRKIRRYPLPFTEHRIKAVLQEFGLTRGKIGIESNDEFLGGFRSAFQHEQFIRLQRKLPQVHFIDASDILWRARMTKTDAEINCIEKACEITRKAYETLFKEAKEGMWIRDVVRILVNSMMKEGGDFPLLGKAGPCGFISLDATYPPDDPHIPVDGRKIKRGSLLHIDTGAVYKGYHADFSRSAVVGSPSDDQKNNWDKVRESIYQAVDILKPGVRLGDIPVMWHGVGLEVVESFFRGINDDLIAEPGMVLSLENHYRNRKVAKGENYHFEETIVVTEEGYKILSAMNSELRII